MRDCRAGAPPATPKVGQPERSPYNYGAIAGRDACVTGQAGSLSYTLTNQL